MQKLNGPEFEQKHWDQMIRLVDDMISGIEGNEESLECTIVTLWKGIHPRFDAPSMDQCKWLLDEVRSRRQEKLDRVG